MYSLVHPYEACKSFNHLLSQEVNLSVSSEAFPWVLSQSESPVSVQM